MDNATGLAMIVFIAIALSFCATPADGKPTDSGVQQDTADTADTGIYDTGYDTRQ